MARVDVVLVLVLGVTARAAERRRAVLAQVHRVARRGRQSGRALARVDVERARNGGLAVGVAVGGRRARGPAERVGPGGALFGTLVATDLDGALEVHLHRVGELERLEVCVGQHGGRRAEVLDLGEAAHQLGPRDAAALVHQLDRAPLAVVRETVPHQHVELVLLVLDRQHHGHGLADLYDSCHLASPRACVRFEWWRWRWRWWAR